MADLIEGAQAPQATADVTSSGAAYDGRVSQMCMSACDEGECSAPRTTYGCGSCCGCLGPCVRGYEEQVMEVRDCG